MMLGVVYVAIGQRYYQETCQSANSLRKHMPDIPITLFSRGCKGNDPMFDNVRLVEEVPPFQAKIRAMKESPYDCTLFLDSDTYVYGDLSDIYLLLHRFDIAVAHAPVRYSYKNVLVPNSFPEYNTGVVAYRDNTKVRYFLDSWDDLFEQIYSIPHDQPSFRHALYNSDLRVATLPSEYNCRMCIGGYVHDKIKILHTRKLLPSLEFVNKVGPRAYVRGEVLEE